MVQLSGFGNIGASERIEKDQLNAVMMIMKQLQRQNQSAQPLQGLENDYLQNIFSDSPEAFQKFAEPYQRYFEEQTLPGIGHQFAASGGLNSSAFPLALRQASTDFGRQLMEGREGQRQGLLGELRSSAYGPLQSLLQTTQKQFQPQNKGLLGGFLPQFGQTGAGADSIRKLLGVLGGAISGGLSSGVPGAFAGAGASLFGSNPFKGTT